METEIAMEGGMDRAMEGRMGREMEEAMTRAIEEGMRRAMKQVATGMEEAMRKAMEGVATAIEESIRRAMEGAKEEGEQRAMAEVEIAEEEGMDRDLYVAAKSGNAALLAEYHKSKCDILGESTPYKNTALHIAASYGRLNIVKKIIESCEGDTETLKAPNKEGNTAMHEACSGGSYGVVSVLLEADEQLALVKNYKDETPLFKAAENGRFSIVKTLLSVTPDECFQRWDHQTPLHLAVRNSQKDVVRLLLDGKPKLAEQIDIYERTPLHIASSAAFSPWERISNLTGHDIVEKLNLVIRSACYRKNKNGETPGHDIVEKLILLNRSACYRKDKNGETPLHIAVREGNSGLVEKILKYEPSCIEVLDGDGRSALHMAVEHATRIYGRSPRDLKRIIASLTPPTFINCADNSEQTALSIAMKKEDEDPQLYAAIRNYLVSRGASLKETERRTSDGKSKKGSGTSSWFHTEPVAVNISLIATVAFAVAFTLPIKISDSFRNDFLFHLLVIADTMAFCYSIGAALLLVFVRGKPSITFMVYILSAISTAGGSLAMTFGAAIHVVVAPNYFWLPLIVWSMVLTMIFTGVISFYGKLFLFAENRKLVLLVIGYPVLNLLTSVFSILEDVLASCGVPVAIRAKLSSLFN